MPQFNSVYKVGIADLETGDILEGTCCGLHCGDHQSTMDFLADGDDQPVSITFDATATLVDDTGHYMVFQPQGGGWNPLTATLIPGRRQRQEAFAPAPQPAVDDHSRTHVGGRRLM